MKRGGSEIGSTLAKLTIFILMEMVCLMLVSRSGIMQKYAIMGAMRSIQVAISGEISDIKGYFQLRRVNRRLAEENLALFNENVRLRAAVSDSICASLSLESNKEFEFIPATILKNTTGTNHNFLILNKGIIHGVEEDMGVVTASGVIGIVRAVAREHCYVLSFINSKQQVSAKILGKEAYGPLKWSGRDISSAIISDIPQHIAIDIGDTVCTSGLSSFYPADIPLGRVTGSRVLNGIHSSIEVELFQRADNINYVIIAKNRWRREIDSLSKSAEENYD